MRSAFLKILLASGLLAVSSSLFPAGAQERLRIADSFPVGHFIPENLLKIWIARVEERTGGKVAFDLYPAEQLGKTKDMLSLTQTGVVDIGYIGPSYISDKLPLSAVAELPGGFSGSCQGTRAMWAIARPGGPLDKAELAPNRVRMLMVVMLAPYQYFSAREPITGLASFAGRKTRVSGGAMEITASKLGAVSIQMSAPEVREAISRGTIDALLFANSSMLPYDLARQVRYGTQGLNLGSFVISYMISTDRWATLPKDVQDAMTEAADYAMRQGCTAIDRLDGEDAARIASQGVTYVKLDDQNRKELAERLADVGRDWARKLDGAGKPGTQILEAFRAAVTE